MQSFNDNLDQVYVFDYADVAGCSSAEELLEERYSLPTVKAGAERSERKKLIDVAPLFRPGFIPPAFFYFKQVESLQRNKEPSAK